MGGGKGGGMLGVGPPKRGRRKKKKGGGGGGRGGGGAERHRVRKHLQLVARIEIRKKCTNKCSRDLAIFLCTCVYIGLQLNLSYKQKLRNMQFSFFFEWRIHNLITGLSECVEECCSVVLCVAVCCSVIRMCRITTDPRNCPRPKTRLRVSLKACRPLQSLG